MSGLLMCARCKVKPRASQMTGALCDDCDDAIDGMTQKQLDADYQKHQAGEVQSNG